MNQSWADFWVMRWQKKHWESWVLLPFAQIYRGLLSLRKCFLQLFYGKQTPVPLIVVGQLTMGGSGKTPMVIALAQYFADKGLRVGIVSRGYHARPPTEPYWVHPHDTAEIAGDEPLMMAQRLPNCAVMIGRSRHAVLEQLISSYQPDLVLSDDGLAHYAMPRTLEILMIDGHRGLGNGMCLPAGGLREPKSRMRDVDLVVINGSNYTQIKADFAIEAQPMHFVHLKTGIKLPLTHAFDGKLAAVAGIANPERFFAMLGRIGLQPECHSYPDHYAFGEADMAFSADWLLMTEKDAVKCKQFAKDNWYYLEIAPKLDSSFLCAVEKLLEAKTSKKT